MEDLDRVRNGAIDRQLHDLSAIGLDWDGPVIKQSQRPAHYSAAIDELAAAGMTYECFCTRKDILRAPVAPHAPPGAYPGTCRDLPSSAVEQLRAERPAPAIRIRSALSRFTVHDELHGRYTGVVDDFVLRRGDGTPAYNLAVVVDDSAQRIDQVVRGDDLLASSPRQAYLTQLLGHPIPQYVHVPLVRNSLGRRLSKRDGAVTLADRTAAGESTKDVVAWLAASLGMSGTSPIELLPEFHVGLVRRASSRSEDP